MKALCRGFISGIWKTVCWCASSREWRKATTPSSPVLEDSTKTSSPVEVKVSWLSENFVYLLFIGGWGGGVEDVPALEIINSPSWTRWELCVCNDFSCIIMCRASGHLAAGFHLQGFTVLYKNWGSEGCCFAWCSLKVATLSSFQDQCVTGDFPSLCCGHVWRVGGRNHCCG